ncbi:MAG: FtsQ-type POTRA domain-containing protein [Acidobacteria bacterium]|nr:FtsQ-type POTRA domain-containing protein [Acidobacteriota bacterium]MCK6684566.1 FtsQ-type POTRA domain-containing protein [Thermoanaerobaculia bacterium]
MTVRSGQTAQHKLAQARRTVPVGRVVSRVVLGVLAGASAVLVFWALRFHPRFHVARVVLEGVPPIRQAQTEEITDAWIGAPILFLDFERSLGGLAQLPWVEEVEARRVIPDTIFVRVKARPAVAVAMKDGELWTVDRRGMWLGPHGDRPGSPAEDFVIIRPKTDEPGFVAAGASFVAAVLEEDATLHARLSEVEVAPDSFAVIDRYSHLRILFSKESVRKGEAVASWRALLALQPELDRHSLLKTDVDLRFSGRIVLRAPAADAARGKT